VPRTLGIVALALPMYVIAAAFGYRYTSVGRLFISGVALTLPLAAVLYSRRLAAGVAAALGGLTLLLALAYDREKQTGLAGETPIWRLDRAEAQSLVFRSDVRGLLTALDRTVPPNEDLGVDGRELAYLYGLYGPYLHRRLRPLRSADVLGEAERLGLQSIYVSPARMRPPPDPDWVATRFGDAGTLLRRVAPSG
jgi:hypothetical protein